MPRWQRCASGLAVLVSGGGAVQPVVNGQCVAGSRQRLAIHQRQLAGGSWQLVCNQPLGGMSEQRCISAVMSLLEHASCLARGGSQIRGGGGLTPVTGQFVVCRFGDMCKGALCTWYHPTASGTTRQPQGDAGSDMLPPRRRTPAAVSVLAEKERAQNWEERKQQSNWAQGRPTHGSEMSPNRAHNNTQGNHEVRALQQPPNAAHAKRAIGKHPPPPPPSTRCPRTPQGRELRPARRGVPATGVATGP